MVASDESLVLELARLGRGIRRVRVDLPSYGATQRGKSVGQRTYRRKSNGQFAGGGAQGTKVTSGKAGGFANAGHRAKLSNNRTARVNAARRKAVRNDIGKNALKGVALYGASQVAIYGASRVVTGRLTPARLNAARDNRLKNQSNKFRRAENHYAKRISSNGMILSKIVNGAHQATKLA